MGLRDAIDAGREKIRTTAEEVISYEGIEKLIKQAVVRGETSISVSFHEQTRKISKGNLYVIQQEVVRQITEEGFKVEWEKPCCPDAYIKNHGGDYYFDERHRQTQRRPDNYYCSYCKTVPSSTDLYYGRITINWVQSEVLL